MTIHPEKSASTAIKTLKDTLWAHGIYNTHVGKMKDGSYRLRRSYYYREPAEKLDRYIDGITLAAGTIGFTVVTFSDDWAAWPKTSYYTVILRPSISKGS